MSNKAGPREGWPELTYRFIEHYFWEPQQRLEGARKPLSAATSEPNATSLESVRRRLRSQELPLNCLLNVLLRVVPRSVRRAAIAPFGVPVDSPALEGLVLKAPKDFKFIQPDVHLESTRARLFIETKIEAPLMLEQIEMYVRLHEKLAAADNPA